MFIFILAIILKTCFVLNPCLHSRAQQTFPFLKMSRVTLKNSTAIPYDRLCTMGVSLLLLILATLASQVKGWDFNVPMSIVFNNNRGPHANITFLCVNEITGAETPQNVLLPFKTLTFTVTPDSKYKVYAALSCYFYNNPDDNAYLVSMDPYGGFSANLDSIVLQYQWNIFDTCFDLVRHYVNGTKLNPCLYVWPPE